MASFIANQKVGKADSSYFSLSLCPTLDIAKKRFQYSSEAKKIHPQIAVGATKDARGVAIKDKPKHISYYLYDYEDNNPYVDFKVDKED